MRTILAAFFFLPLLAAQSTSTRNLRAGRLLVASRDLSDPNFAETVVLLVRHDDEGVLGLILNRPSDTTVAEAVPQLGPLTGAD